MHFCRVLVADSLCLTHVCLMRSVTDLSRFRCAAVLRVPHAAALQQELQTFRHHHQQQEVVGTNSRSQQHVGAQPEDRGA